MILSSLQESIQSQRKMLAQVISEAMSKLAKRCSQKINNQEGLEMILRDGYSDLAFCKHLYVLDSKAIQITNNLTREGIDKTHFKRDRSSRPYMLEIIKNKAEMDFSLSEAYISSNKKRPSITALQTIRNSQGNTIGFLGADFDIRELPHSEKSYKEPDQWRQVKGDPAIRGGLFAQQRAESIMDVRMDEIFSVMEELISEQGVFHGEFHFSSSRCIIWQVDEPLVYRLLNIDDLTDPDICLVLPNRAYPPDAIIPKDKIQPIFEMFRTLRFADENIYLRAGSMNIMNGMVGLNFSCDGSHYIPYGEFLEKSTEFWFGCFI